MPSPLRRSDILAAMQCDRRLWLEHASDSSSRGHPDARTVRRNETARIEALAQQRYPGGLDLDDASDERTARALADPEHKVLYGVWVNAAGYRLRLDILLRHQETWTLVDVRSGARIKRGHLADIGVRIAVARAAGLPITRMLVCHLRRVNTPGPATPERNLKSVDVTARVPDVPLPHPDSLRTVIDAHDEPDVTPGSQCSDPWRCPFLSHCGVGAVSWAQPPAGARDAVESGVDYLSEELLQAVPTGPVYSLDFEARQSPLPVSDAVRPFEPIPFLWVARHSDEPGSRVFSSTETDPRRAFARSLIDSLDGDHPILVWSDYESSTLGRLAALMADLAPELDRLRERLVDLHILVRRGFWSDRLDGQYSVKAVAGAMDASFGYGDLSIDNGRDAALIGLGLQHDLLPRSVEDDLIAYCERDVRALEVVWRYLDARRPTEPLSPEQPG